MELLNPSHEQQRSGSAPPPRLGTLEGAVIGVISNGKENTVPFFDRVESILRERYGVAEVVRRTKLNYSAPAEVDLMSEAMGWDAVLSGVGD
ncbi:MAG: hypothetical protein CL464_09055 [Acidimicrobiaceae bacterium]|nr:hypothetical protein [Acidimicrobiaceae bacterium]MCS5675838.1 hypothetical protein [Acidimicrobiales bacterium]|tara:strand:+ start:1242 stop:1517 length:276 start_codon:yes stop_codon:yes gene_type:complete